LAATAKPLTIKLNVPIGGAAEGVSADLLSKYFTAWYDFLLGTVGIIATIMIMWGGFKWLTSRGDSGIIKDAQDTIWAAITGMILAFGSYTILTLINPNLTTIKMPELKKIGDVAWENKTEDVSVNNATPVQPLNPEGITTAENILGDGNNWWPNLTGNETFVQSSAEALANMRDLGQLPEGFEVTSGYRPDAKPTSQHLAGNAIDVTWPGITQESAQQFVDNLQSSNPGLSTIIETNGENDSTWRQNNNSVGMGIHIDGRTGTPYHER